MKIPLILPQKELQRFSGASLKENLTVDLDIIKKDLPAVYWQLPPGAKTQEHNWPALSLKNNTSHILQQRLSLEGNPFSQIILAVTKDEIELLYLQLLPATPPPLTPQNNCSTLCFLKKYIICVKHTIENLDKLAAATGISSIRTTMLNHALADIFKHNGYHSTPENNPTFTLPIEQFTLVRRINS